MEKLQKSEPAVLWERAQVLATRISESMGLPQLTHRLELDFQGLRLWVRLDVLTSDKYPDMEMRREEFELVSPGDGTGREVWQLAIDIAGFLGMSPPWHYRLQLTWEANEMPKARIEFEPDFGPQFADVPARLAAFTRVPRAQETRDAV